MIVCIQCAMRAMVDGRPYQGDTDETPEAHIARCHADAEATKRERKELEAQLTARVLGEPGDNGKGKG